MFIVFDFQLLALYLQHKNLSYNCFSSVINWDKSFPHSKEECGLRVLGNRMMRIFDHKRGEGNREMGKIT
jgi:hypothetical protein